MDDPILPTKAELRRLYRERRTTLSAADIARLSRDIGDRFLDTVGLDDVKVLSTFIRLPRLNEIDTSVIYYRLWRDHPRIRTVAPSIDLESGAVENVTFTAASELVENRWGIREPLGTCIETPELDMVLVPLLCFDRAGHRVGYGRGFYDRLLAQCRPDCIKVGLSHFPPVASIADPAEFDVTLDLCITPDDVVRFS